MTLSSEIAVLFASKTLMELMAGIVSGALISLAVLRIRLFRHALLFSLAGAIVLGLVEGGVPLLVRSLESVVTHLTAHDLWVKGFFLGKGTVALCDFVYRKMRKVISHP